MDKDAFHQFFVANIETMLALGAAHPNSDKGKMIHALLNLVQPQFDALSERIAALEAKPNRRKKADG